MDGDKEVKIPVTVIMPPWFREALVQINNDLHLLAANPALGEDYK